MRVFLSLQRAGIWFPRAAADALTLEIVSREKRDAVVTREKLSTNVQLHSGNHRVDVV